MYAIIEDSGTQIKVSEGDEIRVDPRELAADTGTLTFDKVLMLGEGDDAKIGGPYVDGAKVTADILAEDAGDKITVWKFKRRTGYQRKRGHRQPYLMVKITGIEG